MPGPQILAILTTFPIEKSIFCHFAYQGQWKCHFDPILTPFWALLSLNFWPWSKCAYLGPLPGGTLEDPQGPQIWPYFNHFGPLWGSWRRLQARPRTSCLWAGGPAQSLTNPCPGPQILVILTTFDLLWKPRKWPHFGPFWPSTCRFALSRLGPLEAPSLNLAKLSILAYFGHFGPYFESWV